jgi:UDP-N-acetylglucosamine--N-acetylmuramyl-(pentapeptide) pyrophosphoryl-undecaprenol N-acetylglucosamine transferase
MSKAYLTPYGVGLGHASRLVTIANQLRHHDVSIRFSSFGEAVAYINLHGFECSRVPPVEFAWSNGGFSIKKSIGNVPLWLSNFARQLTRETRNIISFSPNLVISDSRLSPIVAARMLDIPSIVILNQVKLLLSPAVRKFKVAKLFENINGEFLGILWDISDKIIIPDLPPPNTISENNLSNSWSMRSKVEYVGFTIPRLAIDNQKAEGILKILGFSRDKPIVFMHISGPMETRFPLIEIIIDACKSTGPDIQYIISEGKPGGKIEPKKLSPFGWYYEWCPIKDEIFAISDVVVIRGGHTAISQAIQYGKPMVTIPIQNHGEQLGNSEKIVRMGIGIKVEPYELRSIDIVVAVKEILDNPRYLENAIKLKEITDKQQGFENVIEIVRSYM